MPKVSSVTKIADFMKIIDFISFHYVPRFFQGVSWVSNFTPLRKVFLMHRSPWNLVKSLGKVCCTQQAVWLCSQIRLWVASSEVPRLESANGTFSKSWFKLKPRIAPRLTRIWVWSVYNPTWKNLGICSNLKKIGRIIQLFAKQHESERKHAKIAESRAKQHKKWRFFQKYTRKSQNAPHFCQVWWKLCSEVPFRESGSVLATLRWNNRQIHYKPAGMTRIGLQVTEILPVCIRGYLKDNTKYLVGCVQSVSLCWRCERARMGHRTTKSWEGW